MLNLKMTNKPQLTESAKAEMSNTTTPEAHPLTMEEMPSLNHNEPAASSKVSSTDTPEHFDTLLRGPDVPLAALPAPGEEGAATIITKDDFHALFCGGFDVASEFTALQSLKVSEADKRARAASDSIYDTINDIPALRGLLNPQNKWYGRTFNIAFFFWSMSRAVGQEIAARQPAQGASASGPGEPNIPTYNFSGAKQ